MMRAGLCALLAAAAVAHAALMFREGRWLEHPLTAARLLFCAASMAVYAVAAWRLSRRPPLLRAALPPLLVLGAFGTILWALFVTRGDQRGLVFVFVPALQWLAYGLGSVVVAALPAPGGARA